MGRQVFINGHDYNDLVESVDFSSGLGEGSSASIYCIEGMPEIAAYSPIVVKMDGSTVFKGYVGSPKEKWGDNPPRLLSAQYDCYDEGTGFNQYIVSGSFSGPANQVIEQVINAVKGKYSFPYTFACQSTLSISINVTFDYTYVNDAFTQIASLYSGYWFVTPQDKIYFFTTSIADVSGSSVTIPYSNVQTPYDHSKATDEIVNEVIVVGGEAEAQKNEKWTYTAAHNVHVLESPIAAITVLWGGEPAYLVAEGYSGDPYTASDKDFSNTTSNDTYITRNGTAVTHVIVHHIAAKTATKTDLYHWHVDAPPAGNGWSDIGYHWYIRKDGTVIACRPESKIGAHAKGHNSYSIGIACEGDYEREDTSMPRAQFNALVTKVIDVMTRYNMNRNNLLFHNDVNATECPGKYFPKGDVLKAVKNGSASSVSYTESTNAPAVNGNKKLYINYSEGYLKSVPTYEPAPGTIIDITYKSTYTVSDVFVDSVSIQAIGRRIPMIIADVTITDKETARAQAMAILNQYKNIKETLSLSLVNYQQIYAGDKVYLPWIGEYGVVTATSGRIWCNDFYDNEMRIEVTLL